MEIDCKGLDAVMEFINGANQMTCAQRYVEFGRRMAKDHGKEKPKASKKACAAWLLKELDAVTRESQEKILTELEPEFHEAWKSSLSASKMIKCASCLFPEKVPGVVNDEVRLVVHDILKRLVGPEHKVERKILRIAKRYTKGTSSLDTMLKTADEGFTSFSKLSNIVAQVASSSDLDHCVREVAELEARAYYVNDWHIYMMLESRNADIVRKKMGTPGLMLLLR